jgi:hypothetical protein
MVGRGRSTTACGCCGRPFNPSLDDNLSIYTALREQPRLELKGARGPIDVIVIDSVSALIPD